MRIGGGRGCLMCRSFLLLTIALILILLPLSASAQTRACPAGFNDTPAMPAHYDQGSIVKMKLVGRVLTRPTH